MFSSEVLSPSFSLVSVQSVHRGANTYIQAALHHSALDQGILGGGAQCTVPTLCPCCAKSRLFSITGSHGSQGLEVCTLQPLLVHQVFFFLSLMLATGPRVLSSAPHAVLN